MPLALSPHRRAGVASPGRCLLAPGAVRPVMSCPQVSLHWRRCRWAPGRCTPLAPQARSLCHGSRALHPPLNTTPGPGPATCPSSSPRRSVAAAFPSVGTDMAAAAAAAVFSSSVLRPGLAPLRPWRALSHGALRPAYSTSSSPRSAARYAAPLGGIFIPHLPSSSSCRGVLWGTAGRAPPPFNGRTGRAAG